MRIARAQRATSFFWSDWVSDHCLRACSLAARGLWMEILCIAGSNDGEDYGFGLVGGQPITAALFCNGINTVDDVTNLLKELEDKGVFSRDKRGIIYCRRMLRAQKSRNNGRLGTQSNPLFSFTKNITGGATLQAQDIEDIDIGLNKGKEEGSSKGKERFAPRCRMPDGWKPDAFGIAYAKQRGYSDNTIAKLIRKCRDYHISKGTQIAGERGLAATWRMWIDKEAQFEHERNERNGQPSFADIAKGRLDS